VAGEFNQKCHFPNCIGAIDGKHVVIQVNVDSKYIAVDVFYKWKKINGFSYIYA